MIILGRIVHSRVFVTLTGGETAMPSPPPAIKSFVNLKHVRIDVYPDNNVDDDWRKAWGAESMLRQAGLSHFDSHFDLSAWHFLVDESDRGKKLNACHGKVMQALSSIRDKKGSKLDLAFHTLGLLYESKPFDIGSSIWHDCKSRVRALTFMHTLVAILIGDLDKTWLHSFL
jgi:hypothetical protein